MTYFTQPGAADGPQSALGINAAGAIVPYACRVFRVVVTASPGTDATFNDCATTGAASASNAVLTVPALTAVGTVYELKWPCLAGFTLSAAGGGKFSVSYG